MRITLFCCLLLSFLLQAKIDPNKPSIFIVDANNSSHLLAQQLRTKGYNIIHVRAVDRFVFKATENVITELFDDEISYDQLSPDELDEYIRNNKVEASIAGSERGVIVSDEISHKFNFVMNDYELSKARRNKFLMHKELEKKNVPHIPQEKFNNVEDALAWAKNFNEWPLVIKPLDAASAKGLTLCFDIDCVKMAAKKVLKMKNFEFNQNSEFLVQKFMDGVEYAVNSVIIDDKIVHTDIWQYEKVRVPGGGILYRNLILQDYNGEVQKQLRLYAEDVLKALGFRYSASHMEIMFTKNGPVLVEVGARTPGSGVPIYANQVLDMNQTEVLSIAYTDPEKFKSLSSGYKTDKNVQIMAVNNYTKGAYLNEAGYRQIEKLKTVFQIRISKNKMFTKKLPITQHNGQAVMRVAMVGKKSDIEKDIETIKKLEQSKLFSNKPGRSDCEITFSSTEL